MKFSVFVQTPFHEKFANVVLGFVVSVKLRRLDFDVVVDVIDEFLDVSDGHGRGVVGGGWLTYLEEQEQT